MSFPRVFALAVLCYAGLAAAQTPDSAVLGDAAAGEGKAAVCGACHGMDGNSADAMYPKLAGQNESYIARQLAQIKSGQARQPVMMPFAATLSEQDMQTSALSLCNKEGYPGQTDEAYVKRAQHLYRARRTARSACRPAWPAMVLPAAAWPALPTRSCPDNGPTMWWPSSASGAAACHGATTNMPGSCRTSQSA